MNEWYTRRIAELEADDQVSQTTQTGQSGLALPLTQTQQTKQTTHTTQTKKPAPSHVLPVPVMVSMPPPSNATVVAAAKVAKTPGNGDLSNHDVAADVPARTPLPLPGHDSAASLAALAAPLDLADTPSDSSSTSLSTSPSNVLSGAATAHWPGLPALPPAARAPATAYSSNLRTFNNTDRTTLRTIGVMVDF